MDTFIPPPREEPEVEPEAAPEAPPAAPPEAPTEAAKPPRGKGNIQDEFLNQLRVAGTLVKVLLMSGRELRGTIKAFDAFTILVQCDGKDVLLYKSAIAALGPPPDKRRGGRY